MSGLSGVRSFSPSGPTRDVLDRMAAAQEHRGTDGFEAWVGPGVGLSGPVHSVDGRWVVVLDGRIHHLVRLRSHLNHRFRTDDPGEVVAAGLAVEGISFVDRLQGAFSLVAHDLRANTTYLVRDRLGVLPLHYRHLPGGIAFASEVKALLTVGAAPEVDHRSLDAYLAFRVVPAPDTLFEGVKTVRPAHRLAIMSGGHLEEVAWWSAPETDPGGTWEADDAIEAVRDGVRVAVGSALDPGVPTGVNLTGGLASSLLTAQAQQLCGEEPVHTYTVAFGDEDPDEQARTGRLSSLLGTRHHVVRLHRDDLKDLWGPLTWHRDTPLSHAADLATYVLARAAGRHVSALLCAEGADELFGGQPRHRLAGLARRSSVLNGLPSPVRSSLAQRVERRLGATFSAAERRRLLGHAPTPERRTAPVVGVDDVDADPGLRHGLRHTFPDDALQRLDRMSAAASLEVRLPLLDHRLVDLAFRLPTSARSRAGCPSWVLREAARTLLPDEIIERRVPERGAGSWWYAGHRDNIREHLTASDSWVAATFDPTMLRELLHRHEHGGHEQERIWALVSLEIWHQTFFSDPPSVPRPRGT
ncbi:asparagine synthase-related protein [Nocardioides sp. S5]|uniref:asparagine synthetase B family protein n=1 Tax=Nocardioides sp. S5 TaxID=2017486 RepID=UPI001A8BF4E4|nr:asparagine synthase-related protein [Nocardioides sp. S5]